MRDDEHDLSDVLWLHGTWRVLRVGDVDVAAGLDEAPWLTFDGDGVVFGHAGVNRVRGTWHVVEGAEPPDDAPDAVVLAFGPVVATRMAGTPAATAAERAVLRVLETGGALDRRDDGATLRASDGRVTELRRDPGPTASAG